MAKYLNIIHVKNFNSKIVHADLGNHIMFDSGTIGSSINDVGNWEGSKIGQNCRQIVLKIADMGEGGVKNPEKLPTSFMDGP